MHKRLITAAVVGLGIMTSAMSANAITITMATGNTNGFAFNANTDGSFFAATGNKQIVASFDYSGPLNFRVGQPNNSTSAGDLNSTFFSNGTISNYSGSGTLSSPANGDFSTLSTFLASSGSASSFAYGSILVLDLGVLSSGAVLTLDHDDGASVYQGSVRIGNTTAGPTTEIVENVELASTADTVIVYSRENGAPSVLSVAVPEPVSLALLGTGLLAVAMVRRAKA